MLSGAPGRPVASDEAMRPLVRFVLVIGMSSVLLAGALRAVAMPWGTLTGHLWSGKAQALGELGSLSERSVVYDKDGNVLTILRAEENRKPVELKAVPEIVIHAILDVEDASFYEHKGFDVRSATRALFSNADAGTIKQGGSTITQQLVKKSLLTPERSIDRKVQEAVLATRMEKVMTKDQILERYLNLVYFGNGAYGVEAAAETYFGVPVGQLGPADSAFLAGLIRNPLANDPLKNPEQAKERRNTALQQMVERGHLSAEEGDRLKETPVPAKLTTPLPEKQGYFLEEMKQRLLDDTRLGDTAVERYDAVFRGGLQIYTTFDPKAQQQAELAVRDGVPSGRLNKIGATGALATVEPGNGAVRAVVGGPGFDQFKYDIATHAPGRQPGSTFKAFTLLAALEAGYGASSTVDGSAPCLVRGGGKIDNAGDTIGGGTLTMAAATAGSVNCAFERMAATLGLEKVVEMAHRLGIKGKLDPYPAMVIGSEEVTPLEMAGAYAAIANDGIFHAPTFIDRITGPDGKLILKGTDEGKRVLSTTVARSAMSIMQGVFNGTARGQNLKGRIAAGKTGTTNDSTNTWFVGYTPQAATAVWIGVPTENKPLHGLGGRYSVYGATFAAPIWRAFMNDYLADKPVLDFPKVGPKDQLKSKPFRLPKGAPILPGSGGSGSTVSGSGSKTTTKGGGTGATSPPATKAPGGKGDVTGVTKGGGGGGTGGTKP
jgi:membrane peptidoglycan carboxypeptidase